MTGHGGINEYWPYAAAASAVFIVALLALYFLRGTGGRRGASWKYTKDIDHCRKLMAEKRYDEAAAYIAPLLRKYDISAEFFDAAAIIADHRGKPAQAGRYWRAMQRRYPEMAWGHMRVARFLLRQGKTAQAHRVLERARKLVNDPGTLNSVLAEAAQADGRWDEAIRRWEEVRTMAPGQINGYLQARVCLLAAGRVAEADALLADVAIRMPSNPQVMKAVAAAQKSAEAPPPPGAGG